MRRVLTFVIVLLVGLGLGLGLAGGGWYANKLGFFGGEPPVAPDKEEARKQLLEKLRAKVREGGSDFAGANIDGFRGKGEQTQRVTVDLGEHRHSLERAYIRLDAHPSPGQSPQGVSL